MNSIFEQYTVQDLLRRISKLTADHQPQWGMMRVDQMLKHCQQPFLYESKTIRKKNLKTRIILWFFRPMMSNKKPFKKFLPAPKAYRVDQTNGFTLERNKLIDLIDTFSKKTDDFPLHAVFGKLTKTEMGIGMYKHLDHHLRQFGV